MLEARQMLDASGFAGNDCPPDLNLDAVPTQTVTVGQTLSFNIFTAGGTLVDLDQSGAPTGDTLRVVLDPDVGTDTPNGATITVGGDFSWTPTAGQVGEHTLVVIAIDSGTPPLADAETFIVNVIESTNAAPEVDLNGPAAGEDASATFTEDAGAVSIVDAGLTISDSDSTNLASATVSITNLLDGTDEILSVVTTGTAIISAYNDATGELTLTGNDTVANYQQVLRTLTYNNASQNPETTTRSIDITVNDGADDSVTRTSLVTVVAVNDSPDLQAISAQHVDAGQLIEVIVTATDPENDTLTFQLDRDAPAASIPTSASISFVGNTATISYMHDVADGAGPFTFVVLVTDDDATSPLADSQQFELTINPAGAAPAVDLNGATSGIDFDAAFEEDGGDVPIVASDLAVTDADSVNLASATITITNLLDGPAESLSVDTDGTTITAEYTAATGVLALTGSATLADYQQVLRTLRYNNTSQNPTTTNRSITVVASDGASTSAPATVNLSITASNDAPNLALPAPYNNPATPVQIELGGSVNFTATVTDPDNAPADITFQLDLESSGIGQTDAQPTITTPPTNVPGGAFSWTPSALGTFTITVLANDGLFPDQQSFTVEVVEPAAAGAAILAVAPQDGEEDVRLERDALRVTFDSEIDPATVTSESFYATVAGKKVAGQIRMGSDGKSIALYPDEMLPASTTGRIVVNGDMVRDMAGTPVDGNGDGASGGMGQFEFSTVGVTQLTGTGIFGFIYDSTRSTDDVKVPIVGVTLRVEGLPELTAVTDENGRFELKNTPGGEFFVEFDMSTVTSTPEGFQYLAPVKPFHPVPGMETPLGKGDGRMFDIYFPLVDVSEGIPVTPDQMTVAQFSETDLDQLEQITPGISREEWEKLKVEIPPNTLFFEDGTPASEVQIFPLDPNRIPAPLPIGVDPSIVFSIDAGGASDFGTPAKLTFPNVDGLAPGEERPIWTFDHDAGEWKVTGRAVVSADGSVLETDEGGVTTLGWKGIGDDPLTPVNPGFDDGSPLPDTDGDGTPDDIDPDDDDDGTPDDEEDTEFLITVTVGADVEVTPFFLEAQAGIQLPTQVIEDLAEESEAFRELIGEDPNLQPLGYQFDYMLPDDNLEFDYSLSFSFRVGEFRADLIPEVDKTLFKLVAGFEISAGIGIEGELDITGAEDEFELEEVVIRPGNVEVEGSFEISGSYLCHIPFDIGEKLCEPIVFGPRPLLGLPSIPLGDFSFPLPFGGLAFPFDYNDEFSAGLFASAGTKVAISPKIKITKEEVPVEANATSALSSQVFASQSFDGLELANAIEVPPGPPVSVSTKAFDSDQLYFLLESEDGLVRRGSIHRNDSLGQLLPAGNEYNLMVFSPATNRYYDGTGVAGLGANTIVLDRIGGFDADEDGLIDIAEYIIGTSETSVDTDNDGVSDLAELQQGLNPLDGIAYPSGVIGNTQPSGEVKDVVVEGSLDNPAQQTAFLATGSSGLAIVNVSQFTQPSLLGELDLPGTATAVEVDTISQIAYVAAGGAGLHYVDVSDPLDPTLIRTITEFGSVTQVELVDGTVAIAGRSLALLDAVTGETLETINLPTQNGSITDIAQSGDTLFVISGNSRLHSIAFGDGSNDELDSIDIPVPPVRRITPDDFRLFVADGVAYISNGIETNLVAPGRPLERGGYVTFNVNDPSDLSLISDIELEDLGNDQSGNLQTVLNGSGLALVAAGSTLGLQVQAATDPADTYTLLNSFTTPGTAEAVAVVGGIAFVADGPAGLQVINYRDFDAQGNPPTVSIDIADIDADTGTAGVQVEEGTTVRIMPTINDDVQVRSAELLVDGVVVQNDLSFPYDFSVVVPNLSTGVTSIDVQVRATDTGGNSAISDPITLNIIEDITPPTLRNVSPGAVALVGLQSVSLTFNESLNTSLIDASSIEVVNVANPGATLAVSAVNFRRDDRTVQFRFASQLPEGEYELRINEADFADRAGNAVGTATDTRDFKVVEATAVWTNPAGGNWNDTSNWEGGVLPGPTDGVLIVLNPGAQVIHTGTTQVQRLTVDGELVMQSGTLEAGVFKAEDATITLDGGTIRNTVIQGIAGDGNPITVNGGTLDAVTVNEDLLFDPVSSSRTLTVLNGLTLNGTLTLAARTNQTSVSVNFAGAQTFDGTGEVVFAGTPDNGNQNSLQLTSQQSGSTELLTIGAGMTLRGGKGQVSANASEDSVRILGQVVGAGDGDLFIDDIDNLGSNLLINAPNGGVRLGSVANATIGGVSPGTTLTATTLSNVVLNTDLLVDGTTANRTLTVSDGLTLNGRLILQTDDTQRTATLNFRGTQTVNGAGEIVFGGSPFTSSQNSLHMVNDDSNLAEVLTIGAGITLSGKLGFITSDNPSQDSIKLLGTVVGTEGGFLRLDDISNEGGAFTVDAPNGGVSLDGQITDAVINGTAGTTIEHLSGSLRNVTLNTGLMLDTTRTNRTLDIRDNLVLNGTLTLASTESRTATVRFYGDQSVTGTGDIVFAGTSNSVTSNSLEHNTVNNVAEVLTIGAGITLRGSQGRLSSTNPSQDTIKLLGTVTGQAGGEIQLDDIANEGMAFTVDAPDGGVAIAGQISDAVIDGTAGAVLEQISGSFTDVTLNTDLILDADAGSRSLSVSGLTLNGLLTLASKVSYSATVTFNGEQTVDGTGGILFAGAPNSPSGNSLVFNGVTGVTEILTFGPDIEISGGRGSLSSNNSSQDRIALQGLLEADTNGRIELSGVDNSGTINTDAGTITSNATTNSGEITIDPAGLYAVSGNYTQSATGQLTFGLGGLLTGDFGRMTVSSTATLDGTLDVEHRGGFMPSVGDAIEAITFNSKSGDFATILSPAGFTYQGNSDTGSLTLEVTDVESPVVAPDTTAPQLLASSIDGVALAGMQAISLGFNEALDTSLVDLSSVELVNTANPGAPIAPQSVAFASGNQIAQFRFAPLAAGNYELRITESDFQDPAGNQLGEQIASRAFTVESADAVWINPTGGNWDDVANWQGNVLPGAGDSVLIVLNDGAQIIHRTGTTQVGNVLVDGELNLTGGTLIAEQLQLTDAKARLQGGTLLNSSVTGLVGSDYSLEIESGTLDGVTLSSDTLMEPATGNRTVTIQNGLTLNGRLTLAPRLNETTVTLNLVGEQSIDGTGTIEFSGTPDSNSRANLTFSNQLSGTAETLSIGAGITIQGGKGHISSSSNEDHIRLLGTVVGSVDGDLVFDDIDNGGAAFTVDALSNGANYSGLFFTELANAVVNGAGPMSTFSASSLSAVELNTDLLVDGTTANRTLTVTDGLTLNGRLIVRAMGLKPSPSGETFRFLHWRDGELPHGLAQPL